MTLDEIRPIIGEKLKFMRMELYDLKYVAAGRHSVLRVFIDKEGGVTIDDCENASRELSMLLDVENFSDTPYTLEVSSPGADKPLATQHDFVKVIGQYVRLELKDEGAQGPVVVGKCISCADNVLTVEPEGGGERKIPLDTIAKGKLDIRFK
ncbi:MAG TPA: ribosome maturation factor RimP [Chitinivibrionales bacterium]|jgi:ribosome maturation factor RimP|nr:ribosome maturation factor RimP [Chitinivibrionales bacterium]